MTPDVRWTPPPPVPDRSAWSTAAWTLGQIRAVAPRALAALLGVTLIQGLLPGGIALALRELINETVRLIDADAPSAEPLVPWLVLLFALALVDASRSETYGGATTTSTPSSSVSESASSAQKDAVSPGPLNIFQFPAISTGRSLAGRRDG